MFTLRHAISPEDSFEIERAVSYLVARYNASGYNPKPVILHSLRVACILLEMGYEKKVIIGAVLHDIIEDTEVTHKQLKEDFDQEILDLVKAVSFDKSILDPVEQYKEMYDRVLLYGKDAVVLKCIDIAVNSLYISLAPDPDKRRQLAEKGTYFLALTQRFSSESAWQLLKKRNLDEITRLT